MDVLGMIARPVHRVVSKSYMAMERGPGPVAHPRDQPMLDGIDVDVIDMPNEVAFIPNGVLPIAALPDAALAPRGAARGYPFAAGDAARECRFDQPPARCEIGIAFG